MKQEQEKLCGKHLIILEFIWALGWGCALQPLLVEALTWFEWYKSEQMCRRGIRELRNVGLLKAKTWVDGKSEILSICRMMYVLNWAQVRELHCYGDVYDYFLNGFCTMHRRIGTLIDYWLNTGLYKKFRDYSRQLNCLKENKLGRLTLHMDKDDRCRPKKELRSALTIESLHRHGMSIIDIEEDVNGYLF